MRLILKNGRCSTHDNITQVTHIVIENGLITGFDLPKEDRKEDQIIDLKNALITPGLVDLHVHLREPGFVHKETIKSGTQAAARGGYTTICAMPNTNPVPETVELLEAFYKRVQEDALVKVHTYAPITHKLTSSVCTDQIALKQAGAIAFTNDGVGVQDANVMFEAFKQAQINQSIIAAHAEDDSLKGQGVIHEGEASQRLQLSGIPSVSESTQIARDLLLAEATHTHYHVCHVSTKESVRLIRDAKKAGINVSAEVSPHHLLLNEEDIKVDDANFKMNPPLRSRLDQKALIEGLLDGTIDCIATDHAPHQKDEKAKGFKLAPFGIIGLEHAFALLYTDLVIPKVMTLHALIQAMSQKPSHLFKLNAGNIEIGHAADLAIFDLTRTSTIKEPFVSKSSNTPFMGKVLQADCVMTIVDGKIVWRNAEWNAY